MTFEHIGQISAWANLFQDKTDGASMFSVILIVELLLNISNFLAAYLH